MYVLDDPTEEEYTEIEISKLYDDLQDARDKDDEENKTRDKIHLEKLCKNISRIGLLQPIKVKKQSDTHYSIVAGRFRVLACKRLNWKKIPCTITKTNDKAELLAMTVSENIHRADYNQDEKIKANILHFTARGFSIKDTMYLAKKIHNYGTKGIPERFLDAMEESDYAPNTIFQIMQTLTYIPESIRNTKEYKKLSLDKRIVLTNTKLRDHPKLQKSIIKRIKGMKKGEARLVVAQEIRDLETGATIQDADGSYIFDETRREKVNNKVMTERVPAQQYLDLSVNFNRLMFLLTGHQLKQGETFYEPNHVDNTEKHRITLVKGLTKREIAKLEEGAEIVIDSLTSLLDIIANNNGGIK